VRVRVPATSANLGPGFDACSLALDLHDDVVVQVTESGLDVQVAGEGADRLPAGERHLVVKALRAAFDALGGQPRGLALRCANRIPHGRGLGSSAAAIVAGVVAARALVSKGTERLDDAAVLRLAASLEGHPDNVAACLLGGYTVAWTDDAGAQAISLPVAASIVPVVLYPGSRVPTAKARRLLPEEIPFADAAHAAGRAALLTAAVTVRPDLLMAATHDTLHQNYREQAMPKTLSLVFELRDAGVPAVVSGAGPAVLALVAAAAVADVLEVAPRGWTATQLAVDGEGATVLRLEEADSQ
jgi:homoserine kinase